MNTTHETTTTEAPQPGADIAAEPGHGLRQIDHERSAAVWRELKRRCDVLKPATIDNYAARAAVLLKDVTYWGTNELIMATIKISATLKGRTPGNFPECKALINAALTGRWDEVLEVFKNKHGVKG